MRQTKASPQALRQAQTNLRGLRQTRLFSALLFAVALVGCQAQPKEVFAYQLPNAPFSTAASADARVAAAPAAKQYRESARRRWADTKLDLNQVSAAQLARVPGLTPALAEKIVELRPFRAKRDLLRHHVLSAGQYALAKRYLVVHRSRESTVKAPAKNHRRRSSRAETARAVAPAPTASTQP